MNFKTKLKIASEKNNSLLCVGLDSEIEKIPAHLKKKGYPQYEFNKAIIDATVDLVCSFKPNSAFYEAEGDSGLLQLKMTADYLRKNYGDIPLILDMKRGDIGNSNNGYINYAYNYIHADAVTLNPYLGQEAIKPFLEREDKGVFILCRTSNPGAGEFQDLRINGQKLFEYIAMRVVEKWNFNDNCGLVVGATYPEELNIVRSIAEDLPFLIPGVGSQGADLQKTVEFGTDKTGFNAVINSSRSVIFASPDSNFASKARQEALKVKEEINKFRPI
jgi:orotidine-5'-phosphate decarboxylase